MFIDIVTVWVLIWVCAEGKLGHSSKIVGSCGYRKQENKRLGPDGRDFYVPIGSLSPFSVEVAARETAG